MKLEIVIPLWNEARNLEALVAMMGESQLTRDGTMRVTLVNNGSTDGSDAILARYAGLQWMKIVNLEVNQNYGGGIVHGLRQASADYVGFVPGDMQVHMADIEKIWHVVVAAEYPTQTIFKGNRMTRADGWSTRVVSAIYTKLANLILGLRVEDINGLPKIFPRQLVGLLPAEPVNTFVLDAQTLMTGVRRGWKIVEVPVTFHARREGVSSWSGKRIRVYFHSLQLLWKIRNTRGG